MSKMKCLQQEIYLGTRFAVYQTIFFSIHKTGDLLKFKIMFLTPILKILIYMFLLRSQVLI